MTPLLAPNHQKWALISSDRPQSAAYSQSYEPTSRRAAPASWRCLITDVRHIDGRLQAQSGCQSDKSATDGGDHPGVNGSPIAAPCHACIGERGQGHADDVD